MSLDHVIVWMLVASIVTEIVALLSKGSVLHDMSVVAHVFLSFGLIGCVAYWLCTGW